MGVHGEQSSATGKDVLKGIVVGAIAGVAASFVMNQFQSVLTKITQPQDANNSEDDSSTDSKDKPNREQGAQLQKAQQTKGTELNENDGEQENSNTEQNEQGHEPATVKAASAISEGVFDRELSKEEKKVLGPVMHYAFGITMGALYGAAAELEPIITAGAGTGYGTLVWLGADEAAVPLLGLSKAPSEYPLNIHATAFAAHLVYGTSLELSRNLLRKWLN